MRNSTLTRLIGFLAGVTIVTSAQFAANAQLLTVQCPCNVLGTGSNACSYLVLEAERYIPDSEFDANPLSGFGPVFNDAAAGPDGYGNPILPTNSNASFQAALGTLGPTFGRFADKVTYQMVFSAPGDYYLYFRFTMFDITGNGTYLNEDSFVLPPDFNLDPQTDWTPPGTAGADDGGYTEGCCGGAGFLFILDYQGNGSRTAHNTDTNYFEGNFHWNQLFASQFLGAGITNADGSPRAGNPFHYVVTPGMVGIPQNFTIAYREQGVTIDLFLFSTCTNLLNNYTQAELDQYLVSKVQVQDPGNTVPTPSNSWSYLKMEGESFMAKSNRNFTLGFAAVGPGSTNIDSYATNAILATNTTASGRCALLSQAPSFGRFTDKILYQVQFAYPGDYYLYFRFTMFEYSAGGGNGTYLNEDSFILPPDFNKDSQFDWQPPGTAGADDGGYTEGCCGGAGFLFVLDYQGNGSRTAHNTDVPYWEGNFHWNQLFASQFLGAGITNADGSPRAGSPFHYVVSAGMVGIPQNFQIANREPGVTPDLFLFSTETNLLNDYTQEDLDKLILQPKLYITPSGADVIISWETSACDFVLQSSTTLLPGSWANVLEPATVVGTRYNLTVTPTGKRFYRLKQR